MQDLVEEVLQSTGPCLSSHLASVLTEKHGLSAQAARQRVARRSAAVKSLEHLTFPKNARFLYHRNDYGAPRFWKALVNALKESSPSYSCALQALAERGGILPKSHFHIACGAPLAQQRHLSSEVILQRLLQAGLLELVEVPDIGECVAHAKGADYLNESIAAMKARLLVEDIVLNAVKTWARNLALGSYGRFELRGDDHIEFPRVGTFAWDLSAPSYLRALTNRSDDGGLKPGFIVCDILLGRTVTEAGLEPFVRKCATLRMLKKIGRCLQIYVADGYTNPAFQIARENGIVPATPEALFGEEVAAALLELSRILKDAATTAVDPNKFDRLFRHLGKIEGAANSLRGALFEFIVAELIRKLWTGHVALNQIFRDGGRDVAEVDVLAVIPHRHVYFIECKGHAPDRVVDDEEVEKWLTRRIPIVRKKALEHPEWKHLELHFELWTSGQLSETAARRIADAQSIRASAYTVRVRTGADIAELSAETNDNALQKVLQQHFLGHPLTVMTQDERDNSARYAPKHSVVTENIGIVEASVPMLRIAHSTE